MIYAKPFARKITASIDVIRGGRPMPVRATFLIEFSGDGWSGTLLRLKARRHVRLTTIEEDAAWLTAAAGVATAAVA